ncbi:MAG TPA: hypothetical protein VKR05_00405 [Candidatus Cybelea sp.]|nr:hypothetical protein [Candidatus Cybelea sp.]
MTVAGMFASALTPYAIGWRLLRFSVDTLFLIALLLIVATPSAMERPAKRPPAPTPGERARRALEILGTVVLRLLTFGLAFAVVVGLLTAPSSNAALLIWRLCTAASAAIVLNSRLVNALWNGGSVLRLISTGIACIEVVAFVATLSIDIPAILQSADLATAAAIRDATSDQGLILPNGKRVVASPVVADVFHYLGSHPFRTALDGVIGMAQTHQSLDCAIMSNHDAPTTGYRSQKGVVDYVLPIYVECSPGLEKLDDFITALPYEATTEEQEQDIQACGSVLAGAGRTAMDALKNQPAAQARIASWLPACVPNGSGE